MLNIFEIPGTTGKKICLTLSIVFSAYFCYAQTPVLYGMTYGGGQNSVGSIFKINGDGSGFQTVYSFSSASGKNPYGTLMQASDGKLYGMTLLGGLNHDGVLFRFDPGTLQYKDMVDFNSTNGTSPYGSLIQATDGKLYGMTSAGGSHAAGVIFSYNVTDSTLTGLYDLVDSLGAIPKGDLIESGNGKLYGLTSSGGKNNDGVLFSFDPLTSIYKKYVDFDPAVGIFPFGSLIKGTDNLLYGSTRQGGANNSGVLFRFNPVDSEYAILYQLAGGNEKSPSSGLVLANNGKYYGMTAQGGADSVGTVYSFELSGNAYNVVQEFDTLNGQSPGFNALMQAGDGLLYGMTTYGGSYHSGVIFSIDPSLPGSYVKRHDFNGTDGLYPNGTLLELPSPTLIKKINDKTRLIIYPNPVQNELRIQNAELKFGTIEIYNCIGLLLRQSLILNPGHAPGQSEIQMDISSLPSGFYFVKINAEQEKSIMRFVKE